MNTRLLLPLLAATAVAAALPAAPARADDFKFVSAATCQPYGPDTVASELQVTPTGIYNPGTTLERVLCPMPRDQENSYVTGDVEVSVYYRGMSAYAGRLTCTLYVGSSSMQSTAVYTSTVAGPTAANGARTSLYLTGGTQSTAFYTAPVNVLCALPSKMSLAGLFFNEVKATQGGVP
jgi:hypothetical protein